VWKKTAYTIFVGKPERNIPSHRWEDNINMDLKICGSRYGIRVLRTGAQQMKLGVPQNVGI
jgi:hypothetical protein